MSRYSELIDSSREIDSVLENHSIPLHIACISSDSGFIIAFMHDDSKKSYISIWTSALRGGEKKTLNQENSKFIIAVKSSSYKPILCRLRVKIGSPNFNESKSDPSGYFIVIGIFRDIIYRFELDTDGHMLDYVETSMTDTPNHCELDRHGNRLVTIEGRFIVIRSEQLRRLCKVPCDSDPTGVCWFNFSPKNQISQDFIAVCLSNGKIMVWDGEQPSSEAECESVSLSNFRKGSPLCRITSGTIEECILDKLQERTFLYAVDRMGRLWQLEVVVMLSSSKSRAASRATTLHLNEINRIDIPKDMRSGVTDTVIPQLLPPKGRSSIPSSTTAHQQQQQATGIVRRSTVDRPLAAGATLIEGGSSSSSGSGAESLPLAMILSSNSALLLIATTTRVLVVDTKVSKLVTKLCQSFSHLFDQPSQSVTLISSVDATIVPNAAEYRKWSIEDEGGRPSSLPDIVLLVALPSFTRCATSFTIELTSPSRSQGTGVGPMTGLGTIRSRPSGLTETSHSRQDRSNTKSSRSLLNSGGGSSDDLSTEKGVDNLMNNSYEGNYESDDLEEGGSVMRRGSSITGGSVGGSMVSYFLANGLANLPPDSLLRSVLQSKETVPTRHAGYSARPKQSSGTSWSAPARDKKGAVVDMPVTFVSRIKSSGYGQSDGANTRSKSAPRGRTQTHAASTSSKATRIVSYPMPEQPEPLSDIKIQYQIPSATSPPPIVGLAYNHDGKWLATVVGGSDYRSLLCLKLPISKHSGDGMDFVGHTTRLSNAQFSSDSSMLLATGEKEAYLWRITRTDGPALIINSWRPSSSNTATATAATGVPRRRPSSASSRNEKQEFMGTVCASRFFFVDRFLLLGMRSHVIMYNYAPGGLSNDDLSQRGPSVGSRSKQVHVWDMPGTTVSTLECMNNTHSNIIIATTSDRRILILDASLGAVARDFSSQHTRPIHSIAIPSPSPHVAVSSSACQIFTTASTDGLVALWDLRVSKCVWRYSGHVNRSEALNVAMSPCLTQLAVGSEDGSPRSIDMRTGRELLRAQPHKDVCSSVQFCPLFPQLASASYDGTLRLYGSPDSEYLY